MKYDRNADHSVLGFWAEQNRRDQQRGHGYRPQMKRRSLLNGRRSRVQGSAVRVVIELNCTLVPATERIAITIQTAVKPGTPPNHSSEFSGAFVAGEKVEELSQEHF